VGTIVSAVFVKDRDKFGERLLLETRFCLPVCRSVYPLVLRVFYPRALRKTLVLVRFRNRTSPICSSNPIYVPIAHNSMTNVLTYTSSVAYVSFSVLFYTESPSLRLQHVTTKQLSIDRVSTRVTMIVEEWPSRVQKALFLWQQLAAIGVRLQSANANLRGGNAVEDRIGPRDSRFVSTRCKQA
jgi:hypothetical protein